MIRDIVTIISDIYLHVKISCSFRNRNGTARPPAAGSRTRPPAVPGGRARRVTASESAGARASGLKDDAMSGGDATRTPQAAKR